MASKYKKHDNLKINFKNSNLCDQPLIGKTFRDFYKLINIAPEDSAFWDKITLISLIKHP